MGSDPIEGGLGGQYMLPKYKDPLAAKDIDYFVPNFGPDTETAATMNSLAIAEKQLDHKLIMGTDDSKAKWHNVAKDTLYDYAPELDHDTKTTWKNMEASEE